MFDQGNPTVSHSTSNAGIPRLLFALKEGYTPIMNSQMGGNASRASNTSEKLIDHIGYPTPGVAAMSSMVNMKALPQPSSSCLSISEIANGMRIPFLSQSITENYNGRALQYCPLSPKELMGSLCSLPGWNQKAVMSGEKCMDENFFGLPLNSQGELIQLNSSCKGGFHQLKKPSTVTGSSSSLPMYNHGLPKSTGDYLSLKERHCVERTLPKDQFKLLPVQNYVKENPNVHVASRLGITESCGTGRTDIHWLDSERGNNHFVHLLEPDLNLMNISCHGCRQHDQVQMQTGTGQLRLQENSDQILLHTTQPTMRLMGKDVTVGRSSKDSLGIEDGKVWTDKEIITEHCPTSTVLDNMSAKRHFLQDWGLHPAPEKSKETGAHSFDILSNQVSQSLLQVKAPESRFSYPYSNWQPNIASQNGSLIINGNSSSKLHSFAHPTRSPALFNRAPNFQEPFICETGPLKVSSQMPIPLSTPHNTCQHMDLNSAEFKYKRSLPQATKSAFEFPFLHPDCKEQVQPSWLQATSKSLPPWLLHATQQKRTSITSSQPYSDVGGKYHPCNMSGTNFLSISPVHHSPVASYPCNPMTSHSHMQNSLGPASLPHPPLIPVYPGYKSTSVINMGYRNRSKVKDRPKSKSFPVKGPDHGSKSRKRPAAKVDHSTKPTKIPNLQIQEDFSVMTGLKARGNSSNEMQCNAGALELDSIRDNARGVGCGPKETQKDGLRTSFVIDSSKVDGMTRSGPIKLSAGVKHILKPSQNMDQDNSRPTHSTVPFVAVTKSCRVPESQEKSAKIYRF
ncbi:hypothetical protein L1049_023919 [Liquidambar formosana]|uniref:Uncharacterized protein n=1 Tax=Liquidambar formosana TaxID=63359 RepID=A0AAP0RUA0_LIQFO